MSKTRIDIHLQIDSICNEFENSWTPDGEPDWEFWLNQVSQNCRQELCKRLVEVDIELRQDAGQHVKASDYLKLGKSIPQHVGELMDDNEVIDFGNCETSFVVQDNTVEFGFMNELDQSFARIKEDFSAAWRDDMTLSAVKYVSSIEDPELQRSALCFLATVEAELRLAFESNNTETTPNEMPGTGESIGDYKIIEELGSGSFGRVFRAWDPSLEREVAIKTLHPDKSKDKEVRESFEKEAKIVSKFEHPNIVPVYRFGYENDQAYIVSKFIDGMNLAEYSKLNHISFSRAAGICAQVAGALDYAHAQDIIHRDVKPANILVDKNSKVWLADFGLGLNLTGERAARELAGTVSYMSPEQASLKSQLLDGRADIFSLGIVLYELLTGAKPFVADTRKQVLMLIRESDARPCRQTKGGKNTPVAIDDACIKALKRSPVDRYATAQDFADALEAASTYEPKPIDVSNVTLKPEIDELVAGLARNTHEVWAAQRIKEGWQVGDRRDDKTKTHPDLIPYDELSDAEREYDLLTVINMLKTLTAMGYDISKE